MICALREPSLSSAAPNARTFQEMRARPAMRRGMSPCQLWASPYMMCIDASLLCTVIASLGLMLIC